MPLHHLGDFNDFRVCVVVTSPPWYENCYLIRHVPSGDMVVVDPGGDADRLLAAIAAEGGTVKAIWLTHGHPDHLGAALALETALDVDTLAHQDEEEVIARSSDLNIIFTGESQPGPKRLQLFSGEPELALGGVAVKVIQTPGHTPGGVCFHFGGFALTGDTLFRHGLGRTDLPGGNEQKLWESISRFLGLVPDETVLFSGHGPEWPAGEARRWWKMVA